MHCGVSGVNGMENGSVEGIAFEGADDVEHDKRENRTRVDEDISIACCGLDSRVCKDIVLKIDDMRKACEGDGRDDLRTVPLAFFCVLDLELAFDCGTLTLSSQESLLELNSTR